MLGLGLGVDRGGFVPSAFSPDSVSWFQRLESDSGITLVSGKVDVWADSSGNGRDVTAISASNRPDYGLTQYNGIDVLTFNATNNGRMTASYTLNQPYTIFWVGAFTAGTMYVYDDSTTANAASLLRASSVIQIRSGANLLGNDNISNQIITSVHNGASSVIRQQGVQTGAGNAGTANSTGVYLGSGNAGTFQFTGTMAARFVYQGVADATLIANMEAWLANKYGVSI